MSENSGDIKVEQKGALGAQNNQIAVQNNTYYIMADGAIKSAVEHYPALRQMLLEDFKELLKEELEKMNITDVTNPPIRISVPVLQNASITEEKNIKQIFARLLASSMNETTKDSVHPSFIEVAKQLCSDEAKILQLFAYQPTFPVITLRRENEKGEGLDIIRNFSNIGELSQCEHPYDINKYFDNLVRLGLIENASEFSSLTNKELYEPLKNHPYIKDNMLTIETMKDEYNKVNFKEGYVTLTDYGKSFCKISISEPMVVLTISPPKHE